MEIFACPACGAPLSFRARACGCGTDVAFDPDARRFETDAPQCGNRALIECNWRADGQGALCRACFMTRTVPDAGVGDNAALWRAAEEAKRWVLCNLMRWGLFTAADAAPAPVFDLLAEETAAGEVAVMMGHDEGIVTINVAEADPAVREARRADMSERFRTMIGHFRHELGHFVFERLQRVDGFTDAFRPMFGDETADYEAALQRHYAEGPPADFRERYLTAYASAHPHEDWAETVAHYLHLVDMSDSAAAAGLSPGGVDGYLATQPEPFLTEALALGLGLNHVNRAMGLSDVYPFALTPATREKLGFVQAWIGRAGAVPA